MRIGTLTKTIHLVEAQATDDTAVLMKYGQLVEILREILAPDYKSGLAYMITDGIECMTVDASIVQCITEKDTADELY